MATKQPGVRGPKPGRTTGRLPAAGRGPLGDLRSWPQKTLTEDERRWWKALTDRMPADWFQAGDEALLVDYCRTAVRQQAAVADVGRTGAVQTTKTGRKVSPEFDIEDRLARRLRDLSKQLGLPLPAADRGKPAVRRPPEQVVKLLTGGRR